ncbi:hypothetical protein DL240_06365 [Lujinxingia litoralis]|uniref:Uncharacterized protein n=1 Tax=Lujinxingia litoralis TaxID=2211119 RepID=A0A328C7E0_9DELT|nr:TatD family hydrolase [Lujinxingia litoralis]RAL23773.1 hypothetical protein DL240_06365 [Lujinxingia litoralis]
MIDAHCHLQFEAFDGEREAVICRAADVGVEALVIADYDGARRGMLAELGKTPGVAICVGLHPWALAGMDEQAIGRELQQIGEALRKSEWAAVGECGLDFVRATDADARAEQQRVLEALLDLANVHALPVVLHAVRCHSTLHALLRQRGGCPSGGIMHAYSGSSRQVPLFLMHGLDISVGSRLIRNPEKLRAVVGQVPLDRLHLETDSPDGLVMADSDRAFTEPADVVHIVRAVAEALGLAPETLARRCARNTRELFKLGEGRLGSA